MYLHRARGAPPAVLLAVALLAAPSWAAPAGGADEPDELPRIAGATDGLERRPGLIDLWVDPGRGKLFAELPAPEGPGGEVGRFLWVEGLVTGLGSNPVGLDRSQLGPTRLLVLRRLGGRVVAEVPATAFRASGTADERRAVEQSFATSVVWAAPVAALDPDGRSLVDLTGFAARDAHGVARTLKQRGQGEYTLDAGRSALDLQRCLAFPDNVEMEALLTFAAGDPGPLVAGVAPEGDAVSLVLHQSLLRLPEPGYRPRAADPRAGSYAIDFHDFSAPLDRPVAERWIVRHRLQRADPGAERSPAVEPLVYHLDRAVPEPVRGAVLDGARWWAEAFEAAGFEDAFRVELLPEGVHPLDARYNVIQWVHRSTRGWSYGGGVVDPRTGEMVKGHVLLGSLRVRQDRLLFEGLVGAAATGRGGPSDPLELALARIRQLAAHEVGHTLGLAHNFTASTYGRASVMDYPAPLVRPAPGGGLDLSDAYAAGVGAWDVHAIRYAYAYFPPEVDSAPRLETLLGDGLRRGLLFHSDADARPVGAAQWRASLWDNGADPLDELERVLEVRRRALSAFGEDRIAAGRPLAELEEVLAPVYLWHRYQLEAAAKVLGGLDYRHAVRGDGQPSPRPAGAVHQRRALDLLLASAEPAALDLPERVLALLSPPPPGQLAGRERFEGFAGPAFDPLAAAATAADLAFAALLEPHRAARLVDFHRRDPSLPALEEVLRRATETVFAADAGAEGPRLAEIRLAVQHALVERMIGLAGSPSASPGVAGRVAGELERLAADLEAVTGGTSGRASAQHGHASRLARRIRGWLARPHGPLDPVPAAPEPPPGSPIGGAAGPWWPACSHGGPLAAVGEAAPRRVAPPAVP